MINNMPKKELKLKLDQGGNKEWFRLCIVLNCRRHRNPCPVVDWPLAYKSYSRPLLGNGKHCWPIRWWWPDSCDCPAPKKEYNVISLQQLRMDFGNGMNAIKFCAKFNFNCHHQRPPLSSRRVINLSLGHWVWRAKTIAAITVRSHSFCFSRWSCSGFVSPPPLRPLNWWELISALNVLI